MNTIYTAIAIFSLTAILGMYLLSLVLLDKETPKIVSMVHGLFAVTGLILLITYLYGNDTGPLVSIIIFSIAAFWGLILIYKDVTGKKIPKWLGIAHVLTAVVGYVFLLCFPVIMDITMIETN